MGALCMEQLCGMNLHYQHHSLEYFLDRQVELGLKNVELWGGSPHLYIDDASPERVHTVRNAIQSRVSHQHCGGGGAYPLAQSAISEPGD